MSKYLKNLVAAAGLFSFPLACSAADAPPTVGADGAIPSPLSINLEDFPEEKRKMIQEAYENLLKSKEYVELKELVSMSQERQKLLDGKESELKATLEENRAIQEAMRAEIKDKEKKIEKDKSTPQ